jgi:L-methionine (R)-S-oxide reductase
MSEGIPLPALPRGTLLPAAERAARLAEALPHIAAALDGETDEIAAEATLACLLSQVLVQTSWCGFYRRTGERLLTVGPYQGAMGCLRIPFDRGVCGACAREQRTQLVPDVHAFPDHIACDDATRSELVIPVRALPLTDPGDEGGPRSPPVHRPWRRRGPRALPLTDPGDGGGSESPPVDRTWSRMEQGDPSK